MKMYRRVYKIIERFNIGYKYIQINKPGVYLPYMSILLSVQFGIIPLAMLFTISTNGSSFMNLD